VSAANYPRRVPDRAPRLLVVVPSESDPLARLGEWLSAAGVELDERHLGTGDHNPFNSSARAIFSAAGSDQRRVASVRASRKRACSVSARLDAI